MNPHLPHPRNPSPAIRDTRRPGLRRATEGPPRGHTSKDRSTTLTDTFRRIVAEQQYATIDGVLVDVRSASVTVGIWATDATTNGDTF